jgi:hypothetical protein
MRPGSTWCERPASGPPTIRSRRTPRSPSPGPGAPTVTVAPVSSGGEPSAASSGTASPPTYSPPFAPALARNAVATEATGVPGVASMARSRVTPPVLGARTDRRRRMRTALRARGTRGGVPVDGAGLWTSAPASAARRLPWSRTAAVLVRDWSQRRWEWHNPPRRSPPGAWVRPIWRIRGGRLSRREPPRTARGDP